MVYTRKIPVWWVSLLSNEKKRRHHQRAPEVVAFIREKTYTSPITLKEGLD
jgi:hypothetical protein